VSRFFGLIPARGGSKGIPGKNLYMVAGTPLIDYTIDSAAKSDVLTEVFLSTDDTNIAERAKGTTIKVPGLRPARLADDDTLTVDVAIHVIKHWIKDFDQDDYLVLLQPTSPLRRNHHIHEACDLLQLNSSTAQSLVSVCDVGAHHPARMKVIERDGYLRNYSGEEFEDMRPRQQLPPVFIRNGAIYINKILDIINNERLVSPNCLPYIMSANDSLNIDTFDDICLLNNRLGQST
jgi:CMP-N,N'-diacetyllegionaminic acid synthase